MLMCGFFFISTQILMLNYTCTEKKKTSILLLHGFCEDSRMWQYFMRGMRKKFQIVRIDLPGFGKSPLSRKMSIEEMASEVDRILEKEEIEKFIFVGHSMGGYVALEYAKHFSEKLSGLCLFHSHPFADSDEKKQNRTKAADLVKNGGAKAYVREVISSLFPPNYSKREQVQNLINRAKEYSPEAIENALLAMRDRKDNTEVLKKVDCPVQFIIGKKDTAVPAHFSREQTHLARIADIQILEDVGHMGMFEAGARTKKDLLSFIHLCEVFAGEAKG